MQPQDPSNADSEYNLTPPAAPKPVDGMQSAGGSSGRVIQPSPGFDPVPPQSEAVKAHLDTLPPEPASPPPLPPPPPIGPAGPPPVRMAAASGLSEYHSNPFALTLHGLGRVFEVNGTSGLLLGFFFLLTWVVGYIISFVLVFASISSGAGSAGLTAVIVPLILALASVAFVAALCELITASMEGRTATTSQLLGRGFAKFLPMLGLLILLWIVIGIGFVLVVIPGLFLLGRLSLAPYILVSENLGPIAALKRSFALSKGHVFEVYGAIFASAALSGYGLLSPILSVAGIGTRYEELKQLNESGAPKPPIHWLNWIVPVLTLVFIGGFIGLGVWLSHQAPKTTPAQNSFQTQYYGTSNSAGAH